MIRTFVQDHQKTKKLLAVLRSFKPDLLLLNKKIWLRYEEVFFRHQCVPCASMTSNAVSLKKTSSYLNLIIKAKCTYISYYHLYLMRLMLLPQIFNITFFGIDIVHGPPPTNLGFPMIPG